MSVLPPRPASFSLALLILFVLSSCGIRYDNAPDTLPTLDDGQIGISAATRGEQAISSSADTLSQDVRLSKALRSWAGIIRDQSAQRLQAMGGVWQPWPKGVPEGAAPGPEPLAVPSGIVELLQLLVDNGKAACLAADKSDEPTITVLLTAVCAADQLDASNLAVAAGLALPHPTSPEPKPRFSTNPEGQFKVVNDKETLAELSAATTTLDFSRYRAETAAAFLSGDEQRWALNRSESLSMDVDRLINLGVADLRKPQYSLDFTQLRDRAASLHLLNQCDFDALAAHLQIVKSVSPGKREKWINAVKSDVFSQARFGVKPDQIFSQLWP